MQKTRITHVTDPERGATDKLYTTNDIHISDNWVWVEGDRKLIPMPRVTEIVLGADCRAYDLATPLGLTETENDTTTEQENET